MNRSNAFDGRDGPEVNVSTHERQHSLPANITREITFDWGGKRAGVNHSFSSYVTFLFLFCSGCVNNMMVHWYGSGALEPTNSGINSALIRVIATSIIVNTYLAICACCLCVLYCGMRVILR